MISPNRPKKLGPHSSKDILDYEGFLLEIAPENPVLWTGMKGASAKGRKKVRQVQKRVQHGNMGLALVFVIPNKALNLFQSLSISGSRFWEIWGVPNF